MVGALASRVTAPVRACLSRRSDGRARFRRLSFRRAPDGELGSARPLEVKPPAAGEVEWLDSHRATRCLNRHPGFVEVLGANQHERRARLLSRIGLRIRGRCRRPGHRRNAVRTGCESSRRPARGRHRSCRPRSGLGRRELDHVDGVNAVEGYRVVRSPVARPVRRSSGGHRPAVLLPGPRPRRSDWHSSSGGVGCTRVTAVLWPGRQGRPEPGTHRCGRPTPSSGCGRETRTRADLEIPTLVVSRRMPRRSQLTVGDDEEDDDDEEDSDDEEDDGEGQGCKR